MNRIPELDAHRPELEKWVRGMAQKMDGSAICLSIFTKDYAKGLDSLLQFAVAVMMDKPLYIIAPDSVTIPEHIKKIASAIEVFKENDHASFKVATDRLLAAAKEKGFSA